MKRIKIAAGLAAVLSFASCQTNAEYQSQLNANLDARLSAYHGTTLAEFIARTGLVPVNAYPVAGGKVFVIEGAPVYVTLPATQVTPGITRASACQLLIRAALTGPGGTADDWKIVGTSRSGPCNNLPV
ncbi:hypothetical protein SAMN05216228_100863 [Rhizobium tibeticum]|uniref:Uncharacterized protein n=1 Tax=Rhizobium tibeticum TaxID=501024 RepID=A0A1H8JUA8_9HYPH|nr:hypothetical protein [Rhizobium tibeticum]SEH79348.1 hypothetical protein RTCCBAU85039_2395 [Rhizobium tibeticum]SEN84303.1 hypothetical protein SAMN05216228_100863 [Rhizobium tibeticum]